MRWWPRRRLSLPSTAISGAETLTVERVNQRSFTRPKVIDALVERGVSIASLAKPRRSVLQLKTMLKDVLELLGSMHTAPRTAHDPRPA